MIPVIALIGRPNVGKSTLFNALTKPQEALVADVPGVTRDRRYGRGLVGDHPFWVIDTGGIEVDSDHPLMGMVRQQVEIAIQEADHLFWVVEAPEGLTVSDQELTDFLRPHANKITIVVNKVDHRDPEVACAEFYALGFPHIFPISAKRRQGIRELIEQAFSLLPQKTASEEQPSEEEGLKVALVGRPNVGKSTLTNRILGEERVIVFNQPGTTRDSIYIPMERRGQRYVLIDTAGIRRRKASKEMVEKFAILKTLRAVDEADIVLMVLNAKEGILEQDLRLLNMLVTEGKGLMLVINQWDLLSDKEKKAFKLDLSIRLEFASFAPQYFISALTGSGVGKMFAGLKVISGSIRRTVTTPQLTQLMQKAATEHQPPLVSGRRIKLRFAHVGGRHPLLVVVHGKQVEKLPDSYRRYLSNYFRQALKLVGVPILMRFKTDENPYRQKDS